MIYSTKKRIQWVSHKTFRYYLYPAYVAIWNDPLRQRVLIVKRKHEWLAHPARALKWLLWKYWDAVNWILTKLEDRGWIKSNYGEVICWKNMIKWYKDARSDRR
jgi:hypothetical protein